MQQHRQLRASALRHVHAHYQHIGCKIFQQRRHPQWIMGQQHLHAGIAQHLRVFRLLRGFITCQHHTVRLRGYLQRRFGNDAQQTILLYRL